jgi:hypothetical protein
LLAEGREPEGSLRRWVFTRRDTDAGQAQACQRSYAIGEHMWRVASVHAGPSFDNDQAGTLLAGSSGRRGW